MFLCALHSAHALKSFFTFQGNWDRLSARPLGNHHWLTLNDIAGWMKFLEFGAVTCPD